MKRKIRLSCDIVDSDGCVVGRAYAITAAHNEDFKKYAINVTKTLEDYPYYMQEDFMLFDVQDFEDSEDLEYMEDYDGN